jgi:hypothetical protein
VINRKGQEALCDVTSTSNKFVSDIDDTAAVDPHQFLEALEYLEQAQKTFRIELCNVIVAVVTCKATYAAMLAKYEGQAYYRGKVGFKFPAQPSSQTWLWLVIDDELWYKASDGIPRPVIPMEKIFSQAVRVACFHERSNGSFPTLEVLKTTMRGLYNVRAKNLDGLQRQATTHSTAVPGTARIQPYTIDNRVDKSAHAEGHGMTVQDTNNITINQTPVAAARKLTYLEESTEAPTLPESLALVEVFRSQDDLWATFCKGTAALEGTRLIVKPHLDLQLSPATTLEKLGDTAFMIGHQDMYYKFKATNKTLTEQLYEQLTSCLESPPPPPAMPSPVNRYATPQRVEAGSLDVTPRSIERQTTPRQGNSKYGYGPVTLSQHTRRFGWPMNGKPAHVLILSPTKTMRRFEVVSTDGEEKFLAMDFISTGFEFGRTSIILTGKSYYGGQVEGTFRIAADWSVLKPLYKKFAECQRAKTVEISRTLFLSLISNGMGDTPESTIGKPPPNKAVAMLQSSKTGSPRVGTAPSHSTKAGSTYKPVEDDALLVAMGSKPTTYEAASLRVEAEDDTNPVVLGYEQVIKSSMNHGVIETILKNKVSKDVSGVDMNLALAEALFEECGSHFDMSGTSKQKPVWHAVRAKMEYSRLKAALPSALKQLGLEVDNKSKLTKIEAAELIFKCHVDPGSCSDHIRVKKVRF